MQSGIHPLPTERTVNVRGVAGDEDTADAHLSDLSVMDAKIAAPVQRARLDSRWSALPQYLLRECQRRGVSLCVLDGRHDTPASSTHRKDRHRPELARAQLQLVCGPAVVRLEVSEHEQRIVFRSLERQLQELPDHAVRTVASDDKRGRQLETLPLPIQHNAHAVVALNR